MEQMREIHKISVNDKEVAGLIGRIETNVPQGGIGSDIAGRAAVYKTKLVFDKLMVTIPLLVNRLTLGAAERLPILKIAVESAKDRVMSEVVSDALGEARGVLSLAKNLADSPKVSSKLRATSKDLVKMWQMVVDNLDRREWTEQQAKDFERFKKLPSPKKLIK